MNEISVTLPDGSSRLVRAGATAGDLAGVISPRLGRTALAAVVDERLVDLSFPLHDGAAVRIVTADNPEALGLIRHSTAHLLAAAVTQLFPGTQCGIGPATDDGFFYDFVVERAFVPEDLEAIEKRMKELAARDLPYAREMWPREEALRFFADQGRAAQGPADRGEDRGPGRGLDLHHRRARDLRRLLRRAARALVRPAEGVQAAQHLQCVLEGGRPQPADAARLRDRVRERRRAQGAPPADRGSQEAGPPEAGQGSRAVHVPPVGARCDVLVEQGDHALQPAGELHARGAVPGRIRRGQGAAGVQQGPLGNVRPLAALSPEHVPGRGRRRADGHEGHELPRPHAGLRATRSAAIATCRSGCTSRRRSIATRRRACCPG